MIKIGEKIVITKMSTSTAELFTKPYLRNMIIRNTKMSDSDPFWIKLLPKFIKARLEGRYNLHAVLHNSGWLVLEKLIRGLLGLLVGTWVARYLGPSQFGQLSYVLAYLAFFQTIANLGLDGIIVRDISKFDNVDNDIQNKNNSSKISNGDILGTAFVMRIISGVVCWLLAIIISGLVDGFDSKVMWLTALVGGGLIFQAADTIDLWFQSQLQSKRTIFAKLIAYLISNLLKVLFILLHLSLIYFAIVMFIEMLCSAFALLYSYRYFPCNQKWSYKIKSLGKKLLTESWPFILSGISIMIYMRVDQLMIHNMIGDKDLGIFSAVITIGSITYFIPTILSTSLLPSLSKSKNESEEKYHNQLLQMFRYLLIVSVVISLIISFQSYNIMHLLYGEKYIAGSLPLAVFVFTNIPVFLGVGQNAWILNENKAKYFLVQTLTGSLLSIVLNLILIPKYGILGAASSAVLAQFISAIGINLLLNKSLFYLQFGINIKNNNH